MSKLTNADEVLALVAASAAAGDVTVDPAVQQLLLQAQAHAHAQAEAEAHAQAQAQALTADAALAAAVSSATSTATVTATAAAAAAVSVGGEVKVDAMDAVSAQTMGAILQGPTTDGTIEFIPLPAHQPAAEDTSSSLKRKSIPLSMKKEAIEWIMGPGKGIPSRAEKHFSGLNWDVSASSFRKWWKNRDKIMKDSSTKKRISGGGRKPYLEESEEKLLVVIIQERAKKDRVTRKWIAQTAQQMFQRTNKHFKASENWVTKFIRRHGLSLKRSYVTFEHGPDESEHHMHDAHAAMAHLEPELAAAAAAAAAVVGVARPPAPSVTATSDAVDVVGEESERVVV
ncbi:TPA: hypothetical protein N0F65_004378 [Lagenidium giganteum]|uniref:HTH CENPB-type domain-containing protein n=1 Tax=Lagenidium giganteum TaxID=4803 RepID=A0AAV2ZF31_9STRA|nr:TPA: hypothetical protein N0F65_004378 [Lagenidium giganteum]